MALKNIICHMMQHEDDIANQCNDILDLRTQLGDLVLQGAPSEVTAFSEYGTAQEGRITTIYPSEILTFDSDVGDQKYTVRDRGTIKENDDSLVVQGKSNFGNVGELGVFYAHWSQNDRPSAASTEFPGTSEITEAAAGVDAEQYYGVDYGTPNRFVESFYQNTFTYRIRLVSGSPLVFRWSLYHSGTNQPVEGKLSNTGSNIELEDLSISHSSNFQTIFATIRDQMSQVYFQLEAAALSGDTVIEIDRMAIQRT